MCSIEVWWEFRWVVFGVWGWGWFFVEGSWVFVFVLFCGVVVLWGGRSMGGSAMVGLGWIGLGREGLVRWVRVEGGGEWERMVVMGVGVCGG